MKYLVKGDDGKNHVVEAKGFLPEKMICPVPDYFGLNDGQFVSLQEINGKLAPILDLAKKKAYDDGIAYVEMKAKLPWYKRIFK